MIEFGGAAGSGGGGLIVLGKVVADGTSATMAISEIAGTSQDLIITVAAAFAVPDNAHFMSIVINGDTGENYHSLSVYNGGSSGYQTAGSIYVGNSINALDLGGGEYTILRYANPSFWKSYFGMLRDLGNMYSVAGTWEGVAPITEISVASNDGTHFSAGSSLIIYGRG